jgi:GDP-L-fucose synthase
MTHSLLSFFPRILQIQTNLIDSAFNAGIERVLFLGSSCIYPKFAVSPISEEALMTGPLEPTNETYAIAKIAGVTLINAYRREYGKHWISAMPTNLYGPYDNFDDKSSHVLPALINRFHLAKESGRAEVTIWGDGSALREFLHVSDLAKACFDLLERYDDSVALNIGSGQEVSIYSLAQTVAKAVGFEGQIVFDKSKPNGTPRKYLDSSRISQLGWQPSITLEVGIRQTYEWYLANQQDLRSVRLA